VIWSAVSLVDTAKTSVPAEIGKTPSSSRAVTSSGASAGEIEGHPPLEALSAETSVVHCLCVEECNDEARHKEASSRSEIDKIQWSINEFGNAHSLSCIPGRSPAAEMSSGESGGEVTETTDPSCQAATNQGTNMQVEVRECAQSVGHVELDMVQVRGAAAEEAAAAAEAAAELATAQAASAQSEAVSARIVGRSGKFYTIEIGGADQRTGVSASCLARRFQEFVALDKEVRPRHRALPKLPQKSVFFRRTFKHGFMDDRELRLSAYLSALVANPAVLAEPSVRRFLGSAC